MAKPIGGGLALPAVPTTPTAPAEEFNLADTIRRLAAEMDMANVARQTATGAVLGGLPGAVVEGLAAEMGVASAARDFARAHPEVMGAVPGAVAGAALGGVPGALAGGLGGSLIGGVVGGTSPLPDILRGLGAPPTTANQYGAVAEATLAPTGTPSPSTRSKLAKGATNVAGTTRATMPSVGGATRTAGQAASPTQVAGLGTNPLGWSDEDTREVTRDIVGREMSSQELNAWVDAFYREHGAYPWQIGPFDATNNFLDHLLALGDSERELAMGGASYYTKAGREGNIYAQPAITPDFWGQSYYNRYAGPTYVMGPGGPIATGTRPIMPGELPPPTAPTELAYYGSLSPRPYYEYRPAMSPGEWQVPASGAGGMAFAPPPAPSQWTY